MVHQVPKASKRLCGPYSGLHGVHWETAHRAPNLHRQGRPALTWEVPPLAVAEALLTRAWQLVEEPSPTRDSEEGQERKKKKKGQKGKGGQLDTEPERLESNNHFPP